MAPRRRGFAAINAQSAPQDAVQQELEKIEAVEARLVKQYEHAVQLIATGHKEAAKPHLQQLLLEPLLQDETDSADGMGPATGAAAGKAAGKAWQKAQRPKALDGMRFKILYNLAPLLGETREALDMWCEALRHDPASSKIWEEISIILAHLGHTSLAVYATNKALSLKPDNVVLFERLVVLLAAEGDWAAAGQVLLKLAEVSGGCHPWLLGLPPAIPQANGFTREDIDACIPSVDQHTEYIRRQASHLAIQQQAQQQGQLQPGDLAASYSSDASLTRTQVVTLQCSSMLQLLQQQVELLAQQFYKLPGPYGVSSNSTDSGLPRKALAMVRIVRQKQPLQPPAGTTSISKSAIAVAAGPAAGAANAAQKPNQQLRQVDGRPQPQQEQAAAAADDDAATDAASVPQAQADAQAGATTLAHGAGLASQPAAVGGTTYLGGNTNGVDSTVPGVADQQQQQQRQQQAASAVTNLPQQNGGHTKQLTQPSSRSILANVVNGTRAPAHKPPAPRAGSGRVRGPHWSQAAAQQASKHVITPSQLVKELVGRWLLQPASSTFTAAGGVVGEAQQDLNAHAGAETGTGSAQHLQQQEQQHQQAQQQLQEQKQQHLQGQHHLLQRTPQLNGAAQQYQHQQQQLPASNWQQLEQQILQDLWQQAPMFPLQLTEQLVSALLLAAMQLQLPIEVTHLLLQLSEHLPAKRLLQQQHLVLAELHLDAALLLKQQSATANVTATKRPMNATAAAAGISMVAMATAANKAAGLQKTWAAANSASNAGSGRGKRSRSSSADPGNGVDSMAVATSGDSSTAAAIASAACTAAANCNEATDMQGNDVKLVGEAVAGHAKLCLKVSASGQAARPSLHEKQQTAHSTPIAATSAAAGTSGSGRTPQRRLQEQLEQQVAKHLAACQHHLQEHILAAACSHMRPPGQQASTGGAMSNVLHQHNSGQPVLWGLQELGSQALSILKWQQLQHKQQQGCASSISNLAGVCGSGSTEQHGSGVLHNSSNCSSANSSAGAAVFWGPSVAAWADSGAAQVVQEQGLLYDATGNGAASLIWEQWGPVLRLSGPHMYNGSRVAAAAASTWETLAVPSSYIDPWGCSQWHQHAGYQQVADLLGTVQQEQQNWRSDAAVITANGQQQQEAAQGRGIADLVHSQDSWPTAVTGQVPLQDKLRHWWAHTRLLQALGHLSAADAAGNQCKRLLQQLQTMQQHPDTVASAASDATRVSTEAAPAGAGAAVHDSGNYWLQPASPADAVVLPSCQLDNTITAKLVQEKLDRMWLEMEVNTAEQLVRKQAELQAATAQDAMQQHQQRQQQRQQQQKASQHGPGQQEQQQPAPKQLWCSQQQLAAEQHQQLQMPSGIHTTAATRQQQTWSQLMQQVQHIQVIASDVYSRLEKHCLQGAGELVSLQLRGINSLQQAAHQAATATQKVISVLACAAPHAAAAVHRLYATDGYVPDSIASELSKQHLEHQRFRCIELHCMLLQLRDLLQLHCRSAAARQGPSAAPSGTAAKRAGLDTNSSGGSPLPQQGTGTGATTTAAAVAESLQALVKFWQVCTEPPARPKLCNAAILATQLGSQAGKQRRAPIAHQSSRGQQQQKQQKQGEKDQQRSQTVVTQQYQQQQSSLVVTLDAPATDDAVPAGSKNVDMADAPPWHPSLQQQSSKQVQHLLQQHEVQQHSIGKQGQAEAGGAAAAARSAAQEEQQRAAREASELQQAATLLDDISAAEQVPSAVQVLQLQQHPSLIQLLGQVQQQLVQLLAAHTRALDVPVVAAESAASNAAAATASGGEAATTFAAAAAAGEAGSGGRASKRQRTLTPAAVAAAQTGAAAAAAVVPAGSEAAVAGATPIRPVSAIAAPINKRLSVKASRERQLLVDAACALIVSQDLSPDDAASPASILGMIEGLYCLLGLAVSEAADVVGFLHLAWRRLVAMRHRLQGSNGSCQPEQQEQQQTSQSTCRQLLGDVDRAMAQLLLDAYGLKLPWRDSTFGWKPLVKVLALAAAAAAAARVPSTVAAGVAVVTNEDDNNHSNGLAASGLLAPAGSRSQAATRAAAVLQATKRAIAAIAPTKEGDQDAADVEEWQQSMLRPRVVTNWRLPELLKVWRYVSDGAEPSAILQNPRAKGHYAAANSTVKRQLLALATAATPILLAGDGCSIQQGQSQQVGLPGLQQQQRQSEQQPMQDQQLQLLQEQTPKGNHSTAGLDAVEHWPDQMGTHECAVAGQAESNNREGSELWQARQEQVHEFATELEKAYWQPLQDVVMRLKQQLPRPPQTVINAAADWFGKRLAGAEQSQQRAHGAAADSTQGGLHGWQEQDLQSLVSIVAPSSSDHGHVSILPPLPAVLDDAALQAADPLLHTHRLLYRVAALQRGANPPASFTPGGLTEVQERQQELLLALAVQPDCGWTWARLAQLYRESTQALLEQAAEAAPVAMWRQAAAAAHSSQQPCNTSSSTAPAAGSSGGSAGSMSRPQQVQVLQQYSHHALHSTVMAVQLLQQLVQESAGQEVVAVHLDELGMLLRDQAMCLAPWYEPWKFRPPKTAFRIQILQAAQYCLMQAQKGSSCWEFPFAIAHTASKVKAPGWQSFVLQQYALACHLSSDVDAGGAVFMQPYVKLHGMRLKMLAAALEPQRSRLAAVPAGNAASIVQQTNGSDAAQGTLVDLYETLAEVSNWCFELATKQQLQPFLQQVQQQLQKGLSEQVQQHLLQQIRMGVCQQHQQAYGNSLLQPWVAIVQPLLDDCCNALKFCQECYSKPLRPACYSLALGLYRLGRLDEAHAVLDGLFRPSLHCSKTAGAAGHGAAAPSNPSVDYMTELNRSGDIKPTYRPQRFHTIHERQHPTDDDQRQQQWTKQQQQSWEQGQQQRQQGQGTMAAASLKDGLHSRKRRRASSTVAAGSSQGKQPAPTAGSGAAQGQQHQQPTALLKEQQFQMHSNGAFEAGATALSPHSSWGARPPAVLGWGEDEWESARHWNMAVRRVLLLYLKVLAIKRDMPGLHYTWQMLEYSMRFIKRVGFQPTDLMELCLGLQLWLLLVELAPALKAYQQALQTWQAAAAAQLSEATAQGSMLPTASTAAAAAAAAATSNPAAVDAAQISVHSSSPCAGQTTSAFKLPSTAGARAGNSLYCFVACLSIHQQVHEPIATAGAVMPTSGKPASGVDASSAAHQQQQLHIAFQLFVEHLRRALMPEEGPLKLGELLAAANQLVSEDEQAAATAALWPAAAAAAKLDDVQLYNSNALAEQVLQFLAHAYITQPPQLPQQQQVQQQVQGADVALHAARAPTLHLDKLRDAAKQLKSLFKPAAMRTMGADRQHHVGMVRALCRSVAGQLLEDQQAAANTVIMYITDQLGFGQLVRFQELHVLQQRQPQNSQDARALEDEIAQTPFTGRAAQLGRHDSSSRGESPEPDTAAEQQPPATPAAGALQQVTRAGSGCGTPARLTPSASLAADQGVAAIETPAAAAKPKAATPSGAAAAGRVTPLADATPSGAEGRTRRRAAAAAAQESAALAPAVSNAGDPSSAATAQQTVAVLFDDSNHVAATSALLPVLKGLHDAVKASYGSMLDASEGRRYMRQLYELSWRLVNTAATAAGIPLQALLPSWYGAGVPTEVKAATGLLHGVSHCLSELLKGQATQKMVDTTKSAIQTAAEHKQPRQELQELQEQQEPAQERQQQLVAETFEKQQAGQQQLPAALQTLMAPRHHEQPAQQLQQQQYQVLQQQPQQQTAGLQPSVPAQCGISVVQRQQPQQQLQLLHGQALEGAMQRQGTSKGQQQQAATVRSPSLVQQQQQANAHIALLQSLQAMQPSQQQQWQQVTLQMQLLQTAMQQQGVMVGLPQTNSQAAVSSVHTVVQQQLLQLLRQLATSGQLLQGNMQRGAIVGQQPQAVLQALSSQNGQAVQQHQLTTLVQQLQGQMQQQATIMGQHQQVVTNVSASMLQSVQQAAQQQQQEQMAAPAQYRQGNMQQHGPIVGQQQQATAQGLSSPLQNVQQVQHWQLPLSIRQTQEGAMQLQAQGQQQQGARAQDLVPAPQHICLQQQQQPTPVVLSMTYSDLGTSEQEAQPSGQQIQWHQQQQGDAATSVHAQQYAELLNRLKPFPPLYSQAQAQPEFLQGLAQQLQQPSTGVAVNAVTGAAAHSASTPRTMPATAAAAAGGQMQASILAAPPPPAAPSPKAAASLASTTASKPAANAAGPQATAAAAHPMIQAAAAAAQHISQASFASRSPPQVPMQQGRPQLGQVVGSTDGPSIAAVPACAEPVASAITACNALSLLLSAFASGRRQSVAAAGPAPVSGGSTAQSMDSSEATVDAMDME